MVNRVLIQGGVSAAMRVSLPGYDVTTADIDQTCFDSRWSGLRSYMKGSVASSNDIAATVGFGETLDAPPILFCYHDPFYQIMPDQQFDTPWMFRGGGYDEWAYVVVTRSYLQFRFRFGNQGAMLYYALYRRIAG